MPGERPPLRPVEKSRTAFRTISEVATEIGVQQHVLRFWETRFPQIEPVKRGGNRRYYRPADVELLRRISNLLYQQGYTIKGVQQLLARDGGDGAATSGAGRGDSGPVPAAGPTRSRQPAGAEAPAMPSLAAIRAQLAAALSAARAL